MPLFSQSALCFFFKPFRRDVRDIAILNCGEILVLEVLHVMSSKGLNLLILI